MKDYCSPTTELSISQILELKRFLRSRKPFSYAWIIKWKYDLGFAWERDWNCGREKREILGNKRDVKNIQRSTWKPGEAKLAIVSFMNMNFPLKYK